MKLTEIIKFCIPFVIYIIAVGLGSSDKNNVRNVGLVMLGLLGLYLFFMLYTCYNSRSNDVSNL